MQLDFDFVFDCANDITSLTNRHYFTEGFKLYARITTELLYSKIQDMDYILLSRVLTIIKLMLWHKSNKRITIRSYMICCHDYNRVDLRNFDHYICLLFLLLLKEILILDLLHLIVIFLNLAVYI